MGKSNNYKMISIFLLSVAVITYELFIMRVFSVGNWSNFGSLVISTALLGNGIAGTILVFIIKKVKANKDKWLNISSMLLIPSMALAFVLSQAVPFNPTFLGASSTQVLWIGAYYLLYGVPFFFAALFIGIAFSTLGDEIHKIYFWNMLGSGVGGFLILVLMYFLSPDSLIIPILLLAFIAALCVSLTKNENGESIIESKLFVANTSLFLLSLAIIFIWGSINVSEYKPISYAQKYPDIHQIYHKNSPAGEMVVYDSSYFHFAPGLSDVAAIALEDRMPTQPFWGLYIDGDGPIGIMGKLKEDEAEYMDYLPMAAPYMVLDDPKVLLVGLGGGISAQVAKYKTENQITIFEENPEIFKLMTQEPVITAFNGGVLSEEQFDVNVGDARSFCASTEEKYDMVEISLIDSVGLSSSGGYPVTENYIYTKEAITEYMQGLNDDGILSITVWNKLSPPRNVLKLLTTITASLEEQGYQNPEEHIFMFDLFLSTATILIKKSPISDGELYDLKRFCRKRSFDIVYHPGMEKRDKSLENILLTYHNHFRNNTSGTNGESFTANDFYHLALFNLFEKGADNDLVDQYVFDVRPMTDNRPYYTGFLRLGQMNIYMDQLHDVSEDWGYLLQGGILLQSIVMGFLIILIPIVGCWKELFSKKKGTWSVIIYFSCLGLGYMLVEIFLIQKMVSLLSSPIFSTSITITAMLIISGIGNLVSHKLKIERKNVVRLAAIGITLTMIFYIFGLTPVINALRDANLFFRIVMTIILIAPSAFFLGIPFPNGMAAITDRRPGLISWAWGMNGGLSVTGAALANLLSVSGGFPLPLVITICLYILAGGIIHVFDRKQA